MPPSPPERAPGRSTARVFFALWPSPALAAQLDALGADLHATCGGRRMRRDTLHLTLAFVGEVQRDRLPALREAAGRLVWEPFTLQLDRLGCWQHNHIAWAGARHTPPALARLASDLAHNLRAAGCVLERRAFVPHLTLLRRVENGFACRDMAPLAWPAERFVLVESQRTPDGARYRELAAWPAR